MKIGRKLWYQLASGDVYLYTLSNAEVAVSISTLGCTVQAIQISFPESGERNIVLGYDNAEGYLNDRYYIGSLVGRFAGRISGAAFAIGNDKYRLSANDGGTGNHLHGGHSGFNKKNFWVEEEGCRADSCFVRLKAESADMDEGYPGSVLVSVLIELNQHNEITIVYEAKTDRGTHVNLTHHHYFNLTGNPAAALDQKLVIYADEYAPINSDHLPTGTLVSITGSKYDFRQPKRLSSNFNTPFRLSRSQGDGVDAVLTDTSSGLQVKFSTTYPAVVLYTGDYLDTPFRRSQGICLETQFFPDSPNQSAFPSTLLLPGNTYFHETRMAIGIAR